MKLGPGAKGVSLCVCICTALLLVGVTEPAEALNATWSGLVDTILFDCPGIQFPDVSCGVTQGIPGTPVIDESLTLFKQTTNTYSVVSSLTAFTDISSTTISSQGVAQVDVLRTPTSGTFFTGGEVVYRLTFDAPGFPLLVDLSGSMHRSGPDWGFLVGPGGVELTSFGPPLNFDVQVPQLSFPSAGDYTFHVHTVIPANESLSMIVLAADIVAPPTDQTTGQTRVVWNLQVTPVPWAGSLALLAVGLPGIAFARRSKLSKKAV